MPTDLPWEDSTLAYLLLSGIGVASFLLLGLALILGSQEAHVQQATTTTTTTTTSTSLARTATAP